MVLHNTQLKNLTETGTVLRTFRQGGKKSFPFICDESHCKKAFKSVPNLTFLFFLSFFLSLGDVSFLKTFCSRTQQEHLLLWLFETNYISVQFIEYLGDH